jgi:D-glycero-alpha-D-manno-heptose-7-phosphate kinase
MIIRSRAPLRLGIAGGGSDVDPYCGLYGGLVLNASIDKYAYTTISISRDHRVRFFAADLDEFFEIDSKQNIQIEGPLKLHKAVYKEFMSSYFKGSPIPIEVTTFCDAPMGSGLGSSSTLVVAMIKGYLELLNITMDDYEIANLAFRIERIDCGLHGGKQDQYSAAFGGVNFIEFNKGGNIVVNSLRVKNWILCELEASLILFYTGASRESAKIIQDQTENMNKEGGHFLPIFDALKNEATKMKEALLKGDFNKIVETMQQGWESKKKSATTVSNPKIDKIFDSAIAAGASAGKISGAGGGGYMIFLAPPNKRMSVVRALSEFEGVVGNVHFTNKGAEAWKIG